MGQGSHKQKKIILRKTPSSGRQKRLLSGYLPGADEEVPGWLVKTPVLGKVETAIKLGILKFGDMGLVAPFWAVCFFF